MRLCRFERNGKIEVGFYGEKRIVSVVIAAKLYEQATHDKLELKESDDLLDFLPPQGPNFAAAKKLAAWVEQADDQQVRLAAVPHDKAPLKTPIPKPPKLFLLAGNYAAHIEEGGGVAAERKETFPYVFMKPPSTTLVDPGQPVVVPNVSPKHVDWELELAVVIGQRIKGVKEADALKYVAGYTVVNDISDRKFRPNPGRKPREKDTFFDWQHGKWHDGFCPCGPCITSADAIPDPQTLDLELRLNDEVRQKSTTGHQIFPVAAVIEFLSSFVTLEPGDIISTGTPSGVGNTTGTFLKAGDLLSASISSIGVLVSPVKAEG